MYPKRSELHHIPEITNKLFRVQRSNRVKIILLIERYDIVGCDKRQPKFAERIKKKKFNDITPMVSKPITSSMSFTSRTLVWRCFK